MYAVEYAAGECEETGVNVVVNELLEQDVWLGSYMAAV